MARTGRPRKPVPPPPSQTARARLMGVGGQRADGSPNVAKIAAQVGRSERTVQRWLKDNRIPAKAESTVHELERAEARRSRWMEASDEGALGRALIGDRKKMPAVQDVRGSLFSAYGRADGTIDTRRAAADAGVSQRTVQRWLKGEYRPKVEHQKKIRTAVRGSLIDNNKRVSRLKNRGAVVELHARVTVSSDTRVRRIGGSSDARLSPTQMRRVSEAYKSGGDAAAHKILAEEFARTSYARGWLDKHAVSSISNVKLM